MGYTQTLLFLFLFLDLNQIFKMSLLQTSFLIHWPFFSTFWFFQNDSQNCVSKLDIILGKTSSEFNEKVIFCAL